MTNELTTIICVSVYLVLCIILTVFHKPIDESDYE
jgi:hypothetical protein